MSNTCNFFSFDTLLAKIADQSKNLVTDNQWDRTAIYKNENFPNGLIFLQKMFQISAKY